MVPLQSIRKNGVTGIRLCFGWELLSPIRRCRARPTPTLRLWLGAAYCSRTLPFQAFQESSLSENRVVRLAYNHSDAHSGASVDKIIAKLQTTFRTPFQAMKNLADLDFQLLGEFSAKPLD